MNKPDVLSDEEILTAIETAPEPCPMQFKDEPKIYAVIQAQRDADAAYYEPLLKQAQEQLDYINVQQEALEGKLDDVELAIQQAKAEVAREIQNWIDENNIFRVEFGHYEGIKWIPLQTNKVDVMEIISK